MLAWSKSNAGEEIRMMKTGLMAFCGWLLALAAPAQEDFLAQVERVEIAPVRGAADSERSTMEPGAIRSLRGAFEVAVHRVPACGCLGDDRISFYRGRTLLRRFVIHHGDTLVETHESGAVIRRQLTSDAAWKLSRWLAEQGSPASLGHLKRRDERRRSRERERTARTKLLGLDWDQRPLLPLIEAALNILPEPQRGPRALALLVAGDGAWESVVAEPDFSILRWLRKQDTDLLAAVNHPDAPPSAKLGLLRYLIQERKHNFDPERRAEALITLAPHALSHPRGEVRMRTMKALERLGPRPELVELLFRALAGDFVARRLPWLRPEQQEAMLLYGPRDAPRQASLAAQAAVFLHRFSAPELRPALEAARKEAPAFELGLFDTLLRELPED